MGIARSQMNRQLYGIGSYYPEINGRSKFGLGSKLKKTFRKIIPNEVSSIAVKAAPFVAPFNPLLAGAMAGIGGFDQTGRIGSSLKSGLLTYGGGQLSRYLGGAGFQKGFNPFAGWNPSASFGGLGSLFTSPIGTSTGLKLGQYKLFGGQGADAFKASQMAVDPGIPTESIFTQPGASGTTYLPSDSATEALPLEAGSITPSGQIVSGTAAQNQAILDQLAKQPMTGITPTTIADTTAKAVTTGTKQVAPGYTDLFKQVLQGDMSQKTEALKKLGGKALKDIYTTESGKLDKLAVGATIAGGMSYLEAKKLAKEADLVAQEEEYTKQQYEADRKRYEDYYSEILKPEYFGITSKANGGRVGYRDAGIVSLTDEDSGVIYRDETGKPITKAQAMKLFNEQAYETDMEGIIPPERPMSMKKKRIMEILKKGGGALEKETLDRLLEKYADKEYGSKAPSITLTENKATGGRVGYAMGSEVPVRQNQVGVNEMDFRQTGGFVPPIGVKEKADDIPAMLSNNEFVFTADAVRAAGGGSVNKGAQKMYALMKQLEGKVV